MIAGLRRRHRGMVTALAIITAIAFSWALLQRRPLPVVADPPGAAAQHSRSPAAP